MAVSKDVEDLLTTVEETKGIIEKISAQADEVEKIQATILSSSDQAQRNKDELEHLNKETKKHANLVRGLIDKMQKPGDGSSTTVTERIRKIQKTYLTQWFFDVMRDYHDSQMSFREKCKVQIQRQLEIVNKVATDEELENMLERDNLSIFIADIKPDTQISSQALSEIERRHQQILSLESSVRELHEIFLDTAMMLETQGVLINNIEMNVTSAAEFVVASKEETYAALEYKKNPYKVTFRPKFFKSFKRKDRDTSANHQSTLGVNHDLTRKSV
ncbi:syntaxin-2-like [Pholidichthys leucotaenia]